MKKTCVLAAAMTLLSSGANAFTYNEATDGDILDAPNNPTFLLGAGANTVSGTQGISAVPQIGAADAVTADRDNFFFVVPVGMALTGVSISWSNWITGGAIDTASGHLNGLISCSLLDAGNNVIATVGGSNTNQCVQLSTATVGQRSLFAAALALGPGTYSWFNFRSIDYVERTAAQWTLDYMLTLTVQRVPEPGSLALLGLGLTGLALSRRRKAS